MGSLALSAGPQADHRDRIIASLEQENRELKEQIEEMRLETQQANKAIEQGVGELRRVLLPLHQAMRLVFGEIERIAPNENAAAPSAPSARNSDKWESWKRKLGGKAGEFITELLVHGEMTAQQLMVATKCGQKTMYRTIAELNKAQVLNKNGGKFSLKES